MNRLKLILFSFILNIIFFSFSLSEIIKKIEITGNSRISDETILMFSKINVGQNFKSSILNQIIIDLYETNYFDNTMSVAVIHHISSEERRIQSIKELVRVTKPGGKIFIEVWAMEQGETSRFNFTDQDSPLHDQDKILSYFPNESAKDLLKGSEILLPQGNLSLRPYQALWLCAN